MESKGPATKRGKNEEGEVTKKLDAELSLVPWNGPNWAAYETPATDSH